MPANIAEEISAEKVAALEGSESDLEKFDESDSEDAHTLSCVNCDAEMTPDHQCKLEELIDEPQGLSSNPFSEYRLRWTQRLEKRTVDSALKSRLLESLEDAYWTPLSVLSDGDLNDVKDQFFEGVISPVQFLEKLQNLLHNN